MINRNQLIDCLLNLLHSHPSGICLQKCIFLIPRNIQIARQRARHLGHALPAQNHSSRPHAPAELLCKIQQVLFDFSKMLFLLLLRKIIDLRTDPGICCHSLRCDFDVRKLHPLLCLHAHISLVIDPFNLSGYTDRIKIIRLQLGRLLLLLQHHEQYIFSDILCRNPSVGKHILFKIEHHTWKQ